MTIRRGPSLRLALKIDAWRRERYYLLATGKEIAITCIRTSDYRKLMAVVRAADSDFTAWGDGLCGCGMEETHKAYNALRKHLAKHIKK